MRQIGLVGVGNLGGRHLQALSYLREESCIFIVDPSKDSLERAKTWFMEKAPGPHLHLLECTSIQELPSELDMAIVATSSSMRAKIVAELLSCKTVRYLILEKVLFQRVADYYEVQKLIAAHGCKTWVNCPRRTVAAYHDLASLLRAEESVSISIRGSGWGLGCNGIHFLDLIALLTGDTTFELDASDVSKELLPSKRSGYLEFIGRIKGRSRRCAFLSIECLPEGQEPVLIDIQSPHYSCQIREFADSIRLATGADRWQERQLPIKAKFQSELTGLIVEEIFETGNCALTSYDESMQLHLAFLQALLARMNEGEKEIIDLCPIT